MSDRPRQPLIEYRPSAYPERAEKPGIYHLGGVDAEIDRARSTELIFSQQPRRLEQVWSASAVCLCV